MKTLEDVLTQLHAVAQPARRKGMAAFGIQADRALGVTLPELRHMAKTIGQDHALAQQLWETGIHEARILASIIDDPRQVTVAQMEAWAADFYSWDVTDQCAMNLFRKTPFAYPQALAWTQREPEFVKRAGFALIATLAVHDKRATDEQFSAFFAPIEQHAHDGRNFVKKAVNWALRQIGKRNLNLHAQAVRAAQRIQQQDSASARWIAADALKEFANEKVRQRLQQHANPNPQISA